MCVCPSANARGRLRLGKHFRSAFILHVRPAWQLIACQRCAAGLADQTDPHKSGAVVLVSIRECGSEAAFVNDVTTTHASPNLCTRFPINCNAFLMAASYLFYVIGTRLLNIFILQPASQPIGFVSLRWFERLDMIYKHLDKSHCVGPLSFIMFDCHASRSRSAFELGPLPTDFLWLALCRHCLSFGTCFP